MKRLIFAMAALLSLSLVSCKKEEPTGEKDEPKPIETTLTVSPKSLQFEAEAAAAQTVTVTCNAEWKATVNAAWVNLTPANDGKTLKVEASANDKTEERSAAITVKAGDKSETIDVKQAAAAAPVEEPLPEVIKILAIGNSFSADAVEQELYGLFEAIGQKVIIGDAYIGGCPLEKHAANAKSDAAEYSYRKIVNGVKTTTSSVKLSAIMKDEDWTFVSLQEGAGFHGFYNDSYNGTTHSMEPHLGEMVKYVKEKCPGARLVYHAPWVAKADYTGVKFSYYGFNQAKMYEMIIKATKEVLAAYPDFKLCMNVMDAIQNLRSSYIGDNVNRDGWHLNYTTGRYTAGCLWFERIMGQSVVGNKYHPTTISDGTATVCQTAAHEACQNMYKVTDLSYFQKPADEGGDGEPKKVLAKWYFSPDRSKADGLIKSWTGQDEVDVYRYSLEPGERGYMNANEEGSGKLSYIQVDKTAFVDQGKCAGLQVFKASNGGQPVMCGPMAGDCWQFETTGGNDFQEGTRLHMIFRYNPGSYGAKYWLVEYKDGENFKPAFETKTLTLPADKGGETITYNRAFTTEQETVEFTITLENPMPEFVVRMVCCSTYQVNDKWFAYPNVKCVSRVAGDPNNPEKPLPEMDMML